MSTWLFLTCLDHTPPIRADSESGQHLTDLPDIQHDIRDRDFIVQFWKKGWSPTRPGPGFRLNTARFLVAHPNCRIGIVDEYGHEHPTETTTPPREETTI